MRYIMQVQNVKCAGCASTIQNKLKETEGVSEVEVNIADGTVSIEAENTAREVLSHALAALGYPEKARS